MSWAIRPVVDAATLSDGTILSIPSITVGANGHLHIPEEMYKGGRLTFGRGRKDWGIAKQAVADYVHDQWSNANWAEPVSFDPPHKYEYRSGGAALLVGWRHPRWGNVALECEAVSELRQPPHAMRLRLHAHGLLRMWINREVTQQALFAIRNEPVGEWESSVRSVPQVAATFTRFVEDPKAMLDLCSSSIDTWIDKVMPPDGWSSLQNLDYPRNTFAKTLHSEHIDGVDVQTLYTAQSGDAFLFDERVLQHVIVKNMDELRRMFGAFAARGMKVEFNTRSFYDNTARQWAQRVDGFTIEAKRELGVKGREHDHKFHVSAKGVTVDCGYVEDERLYIEYQTRHAADVLKDMMAEHHQETEESWSTDRIEIGDE